LPTVAAGMPSSGPKRVALGHLLNGALCTSTVASIGLKDAELSSAEIRASDLSFTTLCQRIAELDSDRKILLTNTHVTRVRNRLMTYADYELGPCLAACVERRRVTREIIRQIAQAEPVAVEVIANALTIGEVRLLFRLVLRERPASTPKRNTRIALRRLSKAVRILRDAELSRVPRDLKPQPTGRPNLALQTA
jgi:hypothetical protein